MKKDGGRVTNVCDTQPLALGHVNPRIAAIKSLCGTQLEELEKVFFAVRNIRIHHLQLSTKVNDAILHYQ